ncbi:MAG: glutamyl-tRNA reductase [Myxococcota bacterium]
MANRLVAVGLSHHTAPVSIRENMALAEDAVREELTYLRTSEVASEAMLLSTCNRVELYCVPSSADRLSAYLRRFSDGEDVSRYFYWHRGHAAVRHLFRVATSLDSLVVGEPQILGQVKSAVRVASEAGALGNLLGRLTRRSLWVAKHVRTHTDIGRFTVGIGNAGVQLSEQIFGTLRGRRALLLGAGEMGRQVAKAMLTTGLGELLIANRTFDRSVELARESGGTPVRWENYRDYLGRVDIVIAATGARRPVIELNDVRSALRQRRYKPLFLVDLAVPRNIDPAAEALDQAYLFNVDDLVRVVEQGKQAREVASERAEAIVDAEATRFIQRVPEYEISEKLGVITRDMEAMRQSELSRSAKVLEGLSATQLEAIDTMTRALVKKVLHRPLVAIRSATREDRFHDVAALLEAFSDTYAGKAPPPKVTDKDDD